jgi:archaellum biogenesis ATPase FlaH
VNIGLEIVSSVLSTGEISSFIDCGFNSTWLNSPSATVIFVGNDKAAYDWLLKYYSRHHVVPTLEIFREQFPEASYKLQKEYIPTGQLIDLVFNRVSAYIVADFITKSIELHDNGKIDEAVNLIKSTASTLSSDSSSYNSGYDITSPSYDINKLLDTELEKGIPFGFDNVDNSYWGFQPGQLVTLLGRQKSAKSWLTLYSAYQAWMQGYSVLFFSVEMGEELLHQRLLCLGAQVAPHRMRRGTLHPGEKEKVREFQSTLSSQELGQGRFIISRKKTLITLDDIAEEVSKYKPHIVYIDGFSFMVDRKTGRMTDDWQANENVAAELKSFSMEKEIVSFVNTQVQEKQYNSSRGIEARAIAGGTGLLKASDYVIGLDKEDNIITLSSIRSRFEDFYNFQVEIYFENMEFIILQEEMEKKLQAAKV